MLFRSVIATGFASKNKYSEVQEEEETVSSSQSENVLDYGEFDSLVYGKKSETTSATQTVKQDLGLFDSDIPSEISASQNKDVFGHTLSESPEKNHNVGLTPPEGFHNTNDINQPACWRNVNGLSRTINLEN